VWPTMPSPAAAAAVSPTMLTKRRRPRAEIADPSLFRPKIG
jgi:hypothetical protein